MRILAGDIGGTKTWLALFQVDGSHREILEIDKYVSQAYGSLDEIVRQFVETRGITCPYACFGIAGPVSNGKSKATNLPWLVDARRLGAKIGIDKVWLINDLEANAWGIGALEPEDFCILNPGSPSASGNVSVISAGTGLGEAGMFWDGKIYRPFASEGGHTDFAPNSELEIGLLRHLKRRYDHVSWERVVSGQGLVNIYGFLRDHRRLDPPEWLDEEMRKGDGAAVIANAAPSGDCPVCDEALELFVHLYGVEAGNHALKIMATGGVYIGGGIAPKILDKL